MLGFVNALIATPLSCIFPCMIHVLGRLRECIADDDEVKRVRVLYDDALHSSRLLNVTHCRNIPVSLSLDCSSCACVLVCYCPVCHHPSTFLKLSSCILDMVSQTGTDRDAVHATPALRSQSPDQTTPPQVLF